MKKLLSKLVIGTLATLVATGTVFSTASAENAGANAARTLIKSQNFYFEYGTDANLLKHKYISNMQGIAIDGNKKMIYSPGVFGYMTPNWYTDGKTYYKYIDAKSLVEFNQEQIDDPYINPSDGAVKEAIEVFKSPFPEQLSMITAPEKFTFVSSGSRVIDNKGTIESYDKYSRPVKNALGNEVKNQFFYVYYDNKGTLLGVDSIIVAPDEDADKILDGIVSKDKKNIFMGGKYVFQRTVVTKFNNKLPKDMSKINEKTKLFEPYLGDMNELIENRVPIEKSIK